jgi:hypothetical protein
MKLTDLNTKYVGPLGNPMLFEKSEQGEIHFSHAIAIAIVAMFQGKSQTAPDAPVLTITDHHIMFGLTEKLVACRRAEADGIDLVAEEISYLRRMGEICLHPVVCGYLCKGLAEAESTPPLGIIPRNEEGIAST